MIFLPNSFAFEHDLIAVFIYNTFDALSLVPFKEVHLNIVSEKSVISKNAWQNGCS